jgi:hypothetical protein
LRYIHPHHTRLVSLLPQLASAATPRVYQSAALPRVSCSLQLSSKISSCLLRLHQTESIQGEEEGAVPARAYIYSWQIRNRTGNESVTPFNGFHPCMRSPIAVCEILDDLPALEALIDSLSLMDHGPCILIVLS